MQRPERGAETPVFLASSPAVEGTSGSYFASRKAKRSHPSSYDAAAIGRLWRVSADLAGLPVEAS
jgi:retinol dehydrogenase 14